MTTGRNDSGFPTAVTTTWRARRVDPALADVDWPASLDLSGAVPLKTTDDTSVVQASLRLPAADRPVVVKTQLQPGLWNRIRLAFGATRPDRQWHGSRLLIVTKAFPTPPCLALLDGKTANGTRCLTLVMDLAQGPTLLEQMATLDRLPARAQHALAAAVGAQTRRMLDAGLFNRDHKPSNLIVISIAPDSATSPTLALIDTVGIGQTGARAPEPVGPLASLIIEPIGCGVAPRLALRMRTLRAFEPDPIARKKLWKRVSAAVRAHGDPTPKDNPLSGRL